MEPIDAAQIATRLHHFAGRRVYLHFEFCRGGFVRNLAADVLEAQIRGDGPFRVALRCQEHGWVVMEELTHMDLPGETGPLFLCALEEDQRLARAIQISLEALAP